MERTVAFTTIILGFVALAMWWLESRFGSSMAFNVVMGITHLIAFAGGALLSFAITRGSLRSVNEYAKNDAIIDRYRQQTFKEQAKGDRAWQQAAARLSVMDEQRINNVANQRAKIILERDREARKPKDTWEWGDGSGNVSDDNDYEYGEQEWE